jgi:hypothetical protein
MVIFGGIIWEEHNYTPGGVSRNIVQRRKKINGSTLGSE